MVKNGSVQVGDKVYVECQYSEQLPFKWNATKVALVQSSTQKSPGAGTPSTYLQHRMQQAAMSMTSGPSEQTPWNQQQQAWNQQQAPGSYYARQSDYPGSNQYSQLSYTSTPGKGLFTFVSGNCI